MDGDTRAAPRRCPACGALATEDADWCGQCYSPLAAPEPEVRAEPGGAGERPAAGMDAGSPVAAADAKTPTWTCPTCGHENELELDLCSVCGTSFATFMHQADEPPPDVSPKEALVWSLVFPGLGHRKLGRGLEGLARGVLFAMLFGMTLIMAFSGARSSSFLGVFALFFVMTTIVYAATAYEAMRMAEGAGPLVSARTLMWLTVGVILLSVSLLAMAVAVVARR